MLVGQRFLAGGGRGGAAAPLYCLKNVVFMLNFERLLGLIGLLLSPPGFGVIKVRELSLLVVGLPKKFLTVTWDADCSSLVDFGTACFLRLVLPILVTCTAFDVALVGTFTSSIYSENLPGYTLGDLCLICELLLGEDDPAATVDKCYYIFEMNNELWFCGHSSIPVPAPSFYYFDFWSSRSRSY